VKRGNTIPVIATSAVLALAIVLLCRSDDGAPLHAAPSPTAQPADAPPPAPVVAAPAAAEPAAAPSPAKPATWLLPDGSRVAALNGAVDPKPLADAWPPGVPWSPIVGLERSPAGVDWYVHADGSKSTTEMKWRADLGRDDAVTRLARPTPVAPAAPIAAPR